MASSSDATQRAALQAAQDLAAGLRVHIDPSLPELRTSFPGPTVAAEDADVVFLRADYLGPGGTLPESVSPAPRRVCAVALVAPRITQANGPKVQRWITPFAVLEPHGQCLRVREVAAGTSATDVQARLNTPLVVGSDLVPMHLQPS